MANFTALAVTPRAVAALLDEASLRDRFVNAAYVVVGTATIAGAVSGSPNPVNPPTLGVSVFPYRVSYNTQRRSVSPRTNAAGERFRASLLVDLHLLISAWGPSASEQMQLLAWAARTLEDTPSLGPGLLNRWAMDGEVVFGPGESVELVAEPLSMQDLVAIWEINKGRQQPSLGYVVRMIAIDSKVRLPDNELVRTRTFDQGVVT